MQAPDYRERFADAILDHAMAALPAVMLTGPRGAGKTTTALRRVESIARLDRPGEAAAFRDDPDAALSRARLPLLVDEWQHVPEVMGAIKRAVDAGAAPGSYVVTGSAVSDLADPGWPGTGRITRIGLHPMGRAEVDGSAKPGQMLLDQLIADPSLVPGDPEDAPDLPGYLELASVGGFPAVIGDMPDPARELWLSSYLGQIVSHDIPALGHRPDPIRLRGYLTALAENTAGMPADSSLYRQAGLSAATMRGYDDLLQAAGILTPAPAWTTNRIKRLALRRKIYLADTGLTMAALRVTPDDVLRNGDLYGRLIDAFVAQQLRAHLSGMPGGPVLSHLRGAEGRNEIDQLIDLGARGVVAVEVKTTSAPRTADARHLAWARDQLAERFVLGIVCHTGSRVFRLGERIVALPIECLWRLAL